MKYTRYLFTILAFSIVIFAASSASAQAPTQAQTDTARNRPCGDPWINIAFQQLGYGTPGGFANVGDCNAALYNNGSWNNYDELKRYVKASQEAMTGAGYEFALTKLSDGKIGVILVNGSNVVASGGANVVAAGGLNVIAPGGANVVAAGGLNLQQMNASAFNNLSVANITQTNSRSVFSADKKVVKVGGSTAIVFSIR